MRLNRFLAAVLCVAGLAACEKETASVSPEGGRADVITVDFDLPATRMDLQMEGLAMKTKWEVGDSVSVVYYQSGYDENDQYYSRYVNDPYYIKKADDIASDGKSARFTCDNPHFSYGVNGNVASIAYPYLYEWENQDSVPEILLDSQFGGSLKEMSSYLFMAASGVEAGTDGITGEISLKPFVSVLRFTAGLAFDDIISSDSYKVNAMVARGPAFTYFFTISGRKVTPQRKARDIVLHPADESFENKKLTKDAYMVVGVEGDSFTFTSPSGMYFTYDDDFIQNFTLKEKTIQPGYVYTITQDSIEY